MKRDQYALVCRVCGKEFEARRQDAKYCSATCRTAASRSLRQSAPIFMEKAKKQKNPLPDINSLEARAAIERGEISLYDYFIEHDEEMKAIEDRRGKIIDRNNRLCSEGKITATEMRQRIF
jgi:hypothetical protein